MEEEKKGGGRMMKIVVTNLVPVGLTGTPTACANNYQDQKFSSYGLASWVHFILILFSQTLMTPWKTQGEKASVTQETSPCVLCIVMSCIYDVDVCSMHTGILHTAPYTVFLSVTLG